jgi:hypothetical protein
LQEKMRREFRRPALRRHLQSLAASGASNISGGYDKARCRSHRTKRALPPCRFDRRLRSVSRTDEVCGTCQTYFIANRRDAKFCSAKCAKPAKREAKLRWWRRNKDRGRHPPS